MQLKVVHNAHHVVHESKWLGRKVMQCDFPKPKRGGGRGRQLFDRFALDVRASTGDPTGPPFGENVYYPYRLY
eukprot:5489481-Pyramimonas_sp.AAC.1